MTMLPEPRREAILIVNLLSRHGFLGAGPASAALERHGVKVKRAYAVRSPRRISSLIKAAVDCGEKLVVIGGGDGTIAAAVDPVAYKETALGILPLGTGNDFARALGIPLDPDGAARVIAQGKVIGVNLGRVNGDYFVNAASVGFSADISHRAKGWMKRFFGIGAYVFGAVEAFWLYRPFQATLTIDGKKIDIQTSLVVVWNGRFHAGWELAPTSGGMAESKLLVYSPAAPNRLSLVRMALFLRMSRLVKAPPLLAADAESVLIETQPYQEVDVDGEVLHRTPVTVQLASHALKVVAPVSFDC